MATRLWGSHGRPRSDLKRQDPPKLAVQRQRHRLAPEGMEKDWEVYQNGAGKKKEDLESFVDEGVYQIEKLKENGWITNIKYDDKALHFRRTDG
ncbi:hypothetical protein M9H77_21736 [Catharanthus roseus]|uniref:Uncharacterized protein n=1 Tax=Catharanthus roseus TaxID=4058 RepID=A0ACC0AN63_CATRO|nr:hypothetical protein M9H77_21736 [Catharanthus roseus]